MSDRERARRGERCELAVVVLYLLAPGDRAAVEWWASWVEDRRELTLASTTVLRFDDEGRVVDHVDYWVEHDGRVPPFSGWGGL